MKARYEKDLQQSWLVLEEDVVYQEDYQLQMLNRNDICGLLAMRGQGEDEKSCYWYDITGKSSMRSWYEKKLLKYEDMERFMKQFLKLLKELPNYLLHAECLILDPNYIYCTEERFYFCYYTKEHTDIRERFHVLTEYFVQMTDYEDKEGIYLAYELHKGSMEENYNIREMLDHILENKEKELKETYKGEYKGAYEAKGSEERPYVTEEDHWIDDWIGEQEMVGEVAAERKTVWGYVKYAFQQRKKERWEN